MCVTKNMKKYFCSCIIAKICILLNTSLAISKKYQLARVGEKYYQYVTSPTLYGIDKLSMQENYECRFNLSYVKIQRTNLDSYIKYMEFLKNYCNSDYVSYEEFKVEIYALLVHSNLEIFKKCLNDIPVIPGSNIMPPTNIKLEYMACVQNNISTYKPVSEKENLMQMCLNNIYGYTLNLKSDKNYLLNCLYNLKKEMKFIKSHYLEIPQIESMPKTNYEAFYTSYSTLKLIELAFIYERMISEYGIDDYKEELKNRFHNWIGDSAPKSQKSYCYSVLMSITEYEFQQLRAKIKAVERAMFGPKIKDLFPMVKNISILEKLTSIVNRARNHSSSVTNELYEIFFRILRILVPNSKITLNDFLGNNYDGSTEVSNSLQIPSDQIPFGTIIGESYLEYLIRARYQDEFIPLTEVLWEAEIESMSPSYNDIWDILNDI